MSDKNADPVPEATDLHWGYIIGLTGAFLVLVEQLEESGAIKKEQTLERLQKLRESLEDLPHSQRWIEITMKQIKRMEGDKK